MATQGDRIKQERQRRKLTQAQLAHDAGVVVKTLQRIEQGKVADSKDTVTLLDHLGLPHDAPDDEMVGEDLEATARRLPSAVLFAEVGRRVSQIPGVEPGVQSLPTLGGPATFRTDKGPERQKRDQIGEPDSPPATKSSGQDG